MVYHILKFQPNPIHFGYRKSHRKCILFLYIYSYGKLMEFEHEETNHNSEDSDGQLEELDEKQEMFNDDEYEAQKELKCDNEVISIGSNDDEYVCQCPNCGLMNESE
eukprot:491650_1